MVSIRKIEVAGEGRVTLGPDVMEHLGARPGDQVEVELTDDGKAHLRMAPKKGIEAFFGSIKYDGPPVSLEDIKQAIEDGWAGLR